MILELADATNLHTARPVWPPSGRDVGLVTLAGLAKAVCDAITEDNLCGAAGRGPMDRVETGEAVRRAADIAGASVRVHVTSAGVPFARAP